MRILFMILGVSLFSMPYNLYAQYEEPLADSIMRAEVLGENDGKILAGRHEEYQPDTVKEECNAMFYSKWEEHFEERGFKTSEEVVTTYVDWCVKGYNKKFGK